MVHIDRFGNLVTDLPRSEAGTAVTIAGRTLAVVGTYEDVATGEMLAYIGSAKTVEIAVRDGSAARVLEVPRGTAVRPGGTAGPYR